MTTAVTPISKARQPAGQPVGGVAMRDLPLDQLQPHPANRKRFDQRQLEELAQSLTEVGQLTPAIVRPTTAGAYELLAGERRWRAARLAGFPTLLCLVRSLTDAQALEVLAVENNQREDVHPLEEADLYKALLTVDGYDVAKIAGRLHRSVAYVYDRLKLLQLGVVGRHLFLEGVITVGHAILLARLSKADQARAIGEERKQYSDGGLLEREDTLWDPVAVKETFRYKAVSVAELQAWIDRHVRFEPAKEDLPQLFPDTAAVLAEASTTGLQAIPITWDHVLPEAARAADGSRTWGPMSWRRADGRHGSRRCASELVGYVAAGPRRGEAFVVCTDRKGCRTHWGREIREAAKRAKDREVAEEVGRTPGKPAKANRELSWEEQDRRRKAQRARLAAERTAVLEAIVAKGLPSVDVLLPHLLAEVLMNAGLGVEELLVQRLKVPKFPKGGGVDPLVRAINKTWSPSVIDKALFYAVVGDDLQPYGPDNEPEHLFALARHQGLDPKAIIAAHRAGSAKATPAKKLAGDVRRARKAKAR